MVVNREPWGSQSHTVLLLGLGGNARACVISVTGHRQMNSTVVALGGTLQLRELHFR